MLDQDEAIWLAGLIVEATLNLEDNPGLVVEVEGRMNQWLQVFPAADEVDGKLSGFVLNFPYRGHSGDPLLALRAAGLSLPPDTRTVEWEDDGFASIWIRPDVPVVALAHLISDILQRIAGASDGAALTVQIEYGF